MKIINLLLLICITILSNCSEPKVSPKTAYVTSYNYIPAEVPEAEILLELGSNHTCHFAHYDGHTSAHFGYDYDDGDDIYYLGLPTGTENILKLSGEYTYLVNSEENWELRDLPCDNNHSRIEGSIYYEIINCTTCGGDGEVDCTTCGGDGEVTCTTCNGSGLSSASCTTCGGDGKIENSKECTSCDGSGKDDDGTSCTRCGGDGSADDFCSDCGGYGHPDCTTCDGDGEVTCTATGCDDGDVACTAAGCDDGDVEIKCRTCGGDGYIEDVNTQYYVNTPQNYPSLKLSSDNPKIEYSLTETGTYSSDIIIPISVGNLGEAYMEDNAYSFNIFVRYNPGTDATSTLQIKENAFQVEGLDSDDNTLASNFDRCKLVSLPYKRANVMAVSAGSSLSKSDLNNKINNIMIQAGTHIDLIDKGRYQTIDEYVKSKAGDATKPWYYNDYLDIFIDDNGANSGYEYDALVNIYNANDYDPATVVLFKEKQQRYAWKIGYNSYNMTLLSNRQVYAQGDYNFSNDYKLYLDASDEAFNKLEDMIGYTFFLGDGHDGIGLSEAHKNVEFILRGVNSSQKYVSLDFGGTKGSGWVDPADWYNSYAAIKDDVYFYAETGLFGAASNTEENAVGNPFLAIYNTTYSSDIVCNVIVHEILHASIYGGLGHIEDTKNVMNPFSLSLSDKKNQLIVTGTCLRYVTQEEIYQDGSFKSNVSQWTAINNASEYQ